MRPFYFIEKALTGMRKAPLVNVLATLTIVVSLTLFGIFLVALINANRLAEHWGSRLEVVAYLKNGIPSESLSGLEEEIKRFPEVREINYLSKEDALASLRKGLSEDSSILDGLDVNPLPASIVIKLKDGFQNSAGIKEVAGKLRGRDYIEELQYGGEWLERFSILISIIRFGGAGLGIGLILSTLLIVSNTIRLTIQTRMDEIEVMRLVGATPLFIKIPFFIEGLILGSVGAILATGIMVIAKVFIEYNFGNDLKLLFGGDTDLLPYQVVIGLFSFGTAFGLIASILSLWRFSELD